MSGTLKEALHRPVHQQIADHSEILIGMVGANVTHADLVLYQGIIAGLRLALAVQEDVFKRAGE